MIRATIIAILLVGCSTSNTTDEGTTSGVDAAAGTTEAGTTGGGTTGGDTTGGDTTGDTTDGGSTDGAADSTADFEAEAADFDCILGWNLVNGYYLKNALGDTEASLAVANNADGGAFPVGTVIQLVPFEAMVKRKMGWAPQTNDWEFFFLSVDEAGAKIEVRGTTEVSNAFGGNCFSCHAKAEAKWDFICADDHGCDPLPFSNDAIKAIQDGDPRCSE